MRLKRRLPNPVKTSSDLAQLEIDFIYGLAGIGTSKRNLLCVLFNSALIQRQVKGQCERTKSEQLFQLDWYDFFFSVNQIKALSNGILAKCFSDISNTETGLMDSWFESVRF